jgi:8-oxo-dGTP pyrophosphatase MutT (NUDIX family)
MLKCIGCLIYDSSKKMFLLQQRSKNSTYPLKWGLWGGKLEDGENYIDALYREIREELGIDQIKIDDIKPLDVFVSEDGTFVYTSYIIITNQLPEIHTSSLETNDYVWLPIDSLLKIDLHPATYKTLKNKHHILEKVVFSN